MKKIFFTIALLSVVCCNKKAASTPNPQTIFVASIESGQQLFETNNCAACHQLAEKVVGPSLQNIAQIYNAKKGNLVSFLKEEAEPIVDPSQYESMKLNLEITKTMTDDELKALELYILSKG